jgi:predicted small metal-binding protein
MRKIINCDCGYVVSGDSDDELVRAAQQHAWEAHELKLTPAQVMSLAVPAER